VSVTIMDVFATVGVSADVPITLYMRRPDDDAVMIYFGDEQLTLEFLDVESLERLRDLADEGARRLHAGLELIERGET
jgi:hypothetical protein